MTEAIVVALITGGLSLIGVIYTNSRSAKEIDHKLDKSQAITETKLEELTREVREHNNFAKRVPEIEGEINILEERIKVANHRIDDLEKKE